MTVQPSVEGLSRTEEIEKIQESMKIRLSNLLSKENSVDSSLDRDTEVQWAYQSTPTLEYNTSEGYKLNQEKVEQTTENDYTNVATRKHFRIDDK